MSENGTKKIKVFKKKTELSPAAPAMQAPEPEEIDIGKEINNSALTNHEQEVSEDDEFERLLNQFINSELDDINTGLEEKPSASEPASTAPESKPASGPALNEGEKALLEAYKNFSNSVSMMAGMNDLEIPDFKIEAHDLQPHYRLKIGRYIANDTIKGWEIMMKIHGNALAGLNPGAGDEELLNFAEQAEDEILQLAVISYVEILIEMEGCEIALEERRIRAQRRKIEREIYEEHQRRVERKKRYVEAIESKKFPIDASRLVNNYFKTAQKDPEGAYKVLITSPAVYAPIDTSKLQPRFFGLIKPTPQDGIRVNREIGDFLKKIKG